MQEESWSTILREEIPRALVFGLLAIPFGAISYAIVHGIGYLIAAVGAVAW